jgi:hypothetical protein
MLRKSALLYITCFALANILTGCCNCPPAPTYNYRWTQLTLTNKSYTIDTGKVSFIADTTNDFTTKNYMIDAMLAYELLASNTNNKWSFTNQAYACKCISSFYNPQKSITSLKVFTINPYDNTHPAMSDITEYFRSPKHTGNGAPDGLGNLNLGLPESSHYSPPYGSFWLFLATKPSLGSLHQFKVEITLSDSSTITANTTLVKLN